MIKAYFFQRFGAYIIDIIIVSFVAALFVMPFPQSKNLTRLNDEMHQIQTEYLEGKMEVDTYLTKSQEVSYDIAYETVFPTIVQLSLFILYFAVFAFYNNGQTLGKRLFRIQIVNNDGSKASMNQLVIRSLLIDAILVNLIILGVTVFGGKQVYFYTSYGLDLVQGFFVIVSAIMIGFTKKAQGLHDKICHTQVVQTKRKEEVLCEN